MIFQEKKICAIEIYDSTDGDKVIATICDEKQIMNNGYKVRIIPYLEEKTNDIQ